MNNSFRLIHLYPVSSAGVFGSWTSPQSIVAPVESIERELSPGGRFAVRSAGGDTAEGEYLLVEEPNRLRYTWQWSNSDEITLVHVEFTELSEERTLVELHHEGFRTSESLQRHQAGWGSYFEGLTAYLPSANKC